MYCFLYFISSKKWARFEDLRFGLVARIGKGVSSAVADVRLRGAVRLGRSKSERVRANAVSEHSTAGLIDSLSCRVFRGGCSCVGDTRDTGGRRDQEP